MCMNHVVFEDVYPTGSVRLLFAKIMYLEVDLDYSSLRLILNKMGQLLWKPSTIKNEAWVIWYYYY